MRVPTAYTAVKSMYWRAAWQNTETSLLFVAKNGEGQTFLRHLPAKALKCMCDGAEGLSSC